MRPHSRLVTATVVAGALLLGPVWGATSAGETDRFRFEPGGSGGTRRSFRMGVLPGGSATDSVVVTNKTLEAIRMRIYAADARRQPDGAITIPPFASKASGVGSWVTVSMAEVTVPPGSAERVRFTLRRPQGADDRLGAIVAEEVSSQERGDDVEVITRVALLIHIEDPTKNSGVHMTHVRLTAKRTLVPSSASLEAVLRNPTSDVKEALVKARISTITGRRYELGAKEVDALPGKTQSIRFDWDPVPRIGAFARAEATVIVDGSSSTIRSSLSPIVPVWLLLIIFTVQLYLGASRLLSHRRDGRGT